MREKSSTTSIEYMPETEAPYRNADLPAVVRVARQHAAAVR
ncbi:MAG: hypothetical protein ACR2H9_10450 [Longimicrobiaceae bacterium]